MSQIFVYRGYCFQVCFKQNRSFWVWSYRKHASWVGGVLSTVEIYRRFILFLESFLYQRVQGTHALEWGKYLQIPTFYITNNGRAYGPSKSYVPSKIVVCIKENMTQIWIHVYGNVNAIVLFFSALFATLNFRFLLVKNMKRHKIHFFQKKAFRYLVEMQNIHAAKLEKEMFWCIDSEGGKGMRAECESSFGGKRIISSVNSRSEEGGGCQRESKRVHERSSFYLLV